MPGGGGERVPAWERDWRLRSGRAARCLQLVMGEPEHRRPEFFAKVGQATLAGLRDALRRAGAAGPRDGGPVDRPLRDRARER